MVWVQFFMSAGLIVFSGIKLTRYADILSDRLNIGKVWIGVILLGLVTSLPEAVASITSVLFLKANDLAIGNMVGSNNFNILLIVVMDIFYNQGSVTNKIPYQRSQIRPALYAILLTCLVLGEIKLGTRFPLAHVGSISIGSLLVMMFYFIGIKGLSSTQGEGEQTAIESMPDCHSDPFPSLMKIYLNLFISAVIVVIAAAWLARVADVIAGMTGLGHTFVGTIFLAFVTSLPEMVVTISALKLGALDLAIGNIFGSNMNNIFLISLCDVVYTKGAILANVSAMHITTGMMSLVLTSVALKGIQIKHKRTYGRLGLDSWMLLLLYVLGMYVLYLMK